MSAARERSQVVSIRMTAPESAPALHLAEMDQATGELHPALLRGEWVGVATLHESRNAQGKVTGEPVVILTLHPDPARLSQAGEGPVLLHAGLPIPGVPDAGENPSAPRVQPPKDNSAD